MRAVSGVKNVIYRGFGGSDVELLPLGPITDLIKVILEFSLDIFDVDT